LLAALFTTTLPSPVSGMTGLSLEVRAIGSGSSHRETDAMLIS